MLEQERGFIRPAESVADHASDAPQEEHGPEGERYPDDWVWNNLPKKHRDILLKGAFGDIGVEPNDVVDYASLDWNDFPAGEFQDQLKEKLSQRIGDARPE